MSEELTREEAQFFSKVGNEQFKKRALKMILLKAIQGHAK